MHQPHIFTVEASEAPAPENKRVPFGWKAQAIDAADSARPTRLNPAWPTRQPAVSLAKGTAFLRIAIAIDIREEVLVEARLPQSGKTIGRFDIRYAYALQPFEIAVPGSDLPVVLEQGVSLVMVQGTAPIWILTGAAGEGAADALLPHLLLPQEGADRSKLSYFRQLASLGSIQPFGWMEGCVLDGLADLDAAFPGAGWDEALLRHLRMFVTDDGGLIYENPRSTPSDHHIYGLEGGLPFAQIARLWPEHPLVDMMIQFSLNLPEFDEQKMGGSLTAEGSYTIAYPLAVIAKVRGRRDLADLAVRHLLLRRTFLATEQGVRLRFGSKVSEQFHNWARGYAWYMLGLTRAVIALRSGDSSVMPSTKLLEEEILRVSRVAISYQRADGLWSCFVDDERIKIDTSGSAGIAAALALGAKSGLLPQEALRAAERTYEALWRYVTPDGLLGGVAQSNRNGEALQRSSYRVISQLGMGLMGQLAAGLGRNR
jgi:hypothetical protein